MMHEKLILISFFTTFISLMILRPLAIKFNLVDFPTERKNHIGNIPLIGGISIFIGIVISYFFVIDFDEFSSVLLFTASLILIQGIWDDWKNLQAKTKLFFQVFLTTVVIYITDVKLDSFGYLFGSSYIVELGILSVPITIIAVVGLTNAINMIDGFDGVASGLVLIAVIGLLGFGLKSYVSSLTNILLALAVAVVPFMLFNITPYSKTKVFLGDGGSLFLGFIISWAFIYSSENIKNFNHSFTLWCVAIPLFDFFTVIFMRILEKKSLMIAKRDHIHHTLENFGFSRRTVLVIILFSGLAFLGIGKLVDDNFPALSFTLFVLLFLCYLSVRIHYASMTKSKWY